MTNNVLCDEFAERLADLLERDVDEATRAALESHALACQECGALLADLRKLRIEASNLPVLTPSRDLWSGIAERIDAPVIPLPTGEFAAARRRVRWTRWASMAAAAVLLVALTSTSTYFLTVRGGRTTLPARVASGETKARLDSVKQAAPTTQSSAESVVAVRRTDSAASRVEPSTTPVAAPTAAVPAARLVSNSKRSAEQVYASEIARLHAIVERRRAQLDPVTISVVERNLRVIDDAIAQCKAALAKDPASRFLMESLNNALETKVELLRTATMLPARS
jgi:hypothetical protein